MKKERQVTVEVPKTLLRISKQIWGTGWAYFYALDALTFGITGKPFADWCSVAVMTDSVKLVSKSKAFKIKVPRQFTRFYLLHHVPLIQTVNGNRILCTLRIRDT